MSFTGYLLYSLASFKIQTEGKTTLPSAENLSVQNYITKRKGVKRFEKAKTGFSLATSTKSDMIIFCKKLIPRSIPSEDGRRYGEVKSYLAMGRLTVEEL